MISFTSAERLPHFSRNTGKSSFVSSRFHMDHPNDFELFLRRNYTGRPKNTSMTLHRDLCRLSLCFLRLCDHMNIRQELDDCAFCRHRGIYRGYPCSVREHMVPPPVNNDCPDRTLPRRLFVGSLLHLYQFPVSNGIQLRLDAPVARPVAFAIAISAYIWRAWKLEDKRQVQAPGGTVLWSLALSPHAATVPSDFRAIL